jgi:hypothetical protein
MALCALTGLLAGMWIGYGRGRDHGIEEAEEEMREDARWKGLADTPAAPAPVRPPAPPETPHAGPGKHRHPAGPRHAALPVTGYPAAPGGPWDGTITVSAPVQAPPWDLRAPEAEPLLEPTAVLSPPAPDARTDTAWTRDMAADMDRWIAEHVTATDNCLKEITR